MAGLLLETHPLFLEHDTGAGHPERPARLTAVLEGVEASGVADGVVRVSPRPATADEIQRVHHPDHVARLESFCRAGGGPLDPDTWASPESWDAALLAAGAALDAAERLSAGEGDAAFVVARPPGHHATPSRAMGFCLLNTVAICAASLAEQGHRVLIVDWDAHHGNGTQDAFYDDPRVAYVSFHEYPLYPGTGRLSETGRGAAEGTTLNFPFPAGTTGDAYLAALDEVVEPFVERFAPTWLLISAGFDAHRADPLTSLGLTAGDFADLVARVTPWAPPGRRLAVLEGGYDLDALRSSTAATVAGLLGRRTATERSTSGSHGGPVVEAARRLHHGPPEAHAPAPVRR